ncbi:MAG: BamA/TamA family outer membrane protein [Desulfuromonadales bacterium]
MRRSGKLMGKGLILALSLLVSLSLAAPDSTRAVESEIHYAGAVPAASPHYRNFLLVPFPFYNDTIGTGIGVAGIAEGYPQPQSLVVGSGLYSAEGNGMLFLMARNHRLPWLQRLFIEPSLSVGKFEELKTYTIGNPAFPNEQPGSNDSSKDNYNETDGTDNWFDLNFKFLLPIGHGKDNILPRYTLFQGIPTDGFPGGFHWNPFQSGRSFIETEFFFRNQELDDPEIPDQETLGVEIALTWDNTDFYVNPSRGSFWRFFAARDWGALSGSPSWTIAGGEISKYFDLGSTPSARQRTLALHAWTVDSPTWESFTIKDGEKVYHRPPSYKGANLGGLWRLRGFPATRFRDRAAVHYSAEYRHTLAWNPLKDITLGGRLDIDWLQLVGFADVGRVADEWQVETLHKDMKWSAGAGLRMMVNHLVLRVDLAASDEDVIAQMFISQPWPKR